MITYKKCSEVEKEVLFQTFTDGFSDYMIKIPITIDQFFSRFLGPEGNKLEHSFIALDGNLGVGLILGGIQNFDNLKTMRCGTMCINPNYRGNEISRELFALHKNEALKESCKQLFLEVIVGNNRAIKFYENQGYEKLYDLQYYSAETETLNLSHKNFSIEPITLKELINFRNTFSGCHINWQNEMFYLEKLNVESFAIKENGNLLSAICAVNGQIHFIGVDSFHRNKGLGTAMVSSIIEKDISKLRISFSNNRNLKGFFEKIGFKKEPISQYEMCKVL